MMMEEVNQQQQLNVNGNLVIKSRCRVGSLSVFSTNSVCVSLLHFPRIVNIVLIESAIEQ